MRGTALVVYATNVGIPLYKVEAAKMASRSGSSVELDGRSQSVCK